MPSSPDRDDVTAVPGSFTSGRRRNNWVATVDPTVDDDETLFYEEGSRWLNTVTREIWSCARSEAGNALWTAGGPPGPPGADGGSYHHVQAVPATTWTVNHMLGRHPVVSVLDSADTQIEVFVEHTTLDQLVLTLSYAVSGTADCS